MLGTACLFSGCAALSYQILWTREIALDLRGRVNWLTIQVGNYSGRPTDAQIEWIARFEGLAEGLFQRLPG